MTSNHLLSATLWRNWTGKRGSRNPVSWNSLVNGRKNLKLAGVLGNAPRACTSSAVIYRRPYQPLLSSSCQLGRPNGWLKCMCGHPGVKWKLRLWQKMDSCGRAHGLMQRNVIDMLLCFIISPPALQRITIALPYTAIWRMSCTAPKRGDVPPLPLLPSFGQIHSFFRRIILVFAAREIPKQLKTAC